jgi:tetratricopeptide (TPR) repeat protein
MVLAINGADTPQEQLAALDDYAKAPADSNFMPCVYEYYVTTYLKLNNNDKAIEYGEKDMASNYKSLNLILNLLRAYVASGKVSDSVLDTIMKVPDQINAETNTTKPEKVSDAEWQKVQQEQSEQAENYRAYAVYAFFQLLPRVTDATKRLESLEKFVKTYPDAEKKYGGQIYFAYFQAYLLANNLEKTLEYGEKAIAADPNNLDAYNWMAYLYGVIARTNLDKATQYANKALELTQALKKPEGMSDADFKKAQDSQLGKAHLILGVVEFTKAGKTHKVAPVIEELKTAADVLEANPGLQEEAFFFLGNAYEFESPPKHRDAIEALTKASNLPGRWQEQSKDLLAKVKKAAAAAAKEE